MRERIHFGTRSCGSEVQVDEAIKDGQFTAVPDRKEALRKVLSEVSDRHLAAEDESNDPGAEAGSDH